MNYSTTGLSGPFTIRDIKKLESQNWIPCYKSIKTMAFR
jgi:hypothetical protein